MKKRVLLLLTVVMIHGWGFNATTHALTLPDPYTSAYLYGDFSSYSLPVLAYQYDLLYGVGTGPTNPFYVASTGNDINSSIVVGTGAAGVPVVTNFPGMDNAYPTPSNPSGGTAPNFSTGTTTDPGPAFPGDQSSTWDSQISAFMTYLDGQSPVFLFNNNENNSGSALEQSLFVWGQLILRDSSGQSSPIYYDLTNTPSGGQPGGNPSSYDSPGAWTPSDSDYVLSGGQVCVLGSNIVPCSTIGSTPINHNLGRNQAAYAVVSLELNNFLASWDTSSTYDILSIDFRLREINNGYEQLFILPGTILLPPPTVVPEPSTIILLLVGLVGLAASRCCMRKG